jgi:hypothetical protein
VTTIREGREFEDLDYPDEEDRIEKLNDAKRNFILWPRKDIIIKICSLPIVLPQSREDEGIPTSQNTIRSIVAFTPPYENPPKTIPPLKNPTSTQPLGHHSPQHRSSPHGHSSKSPPHTTRPLQNLPTEQAPQQSSPRVHSLKPPHTTPPLQKPSTEQAHQQCSPPYVHSPKSPPHTTPHLQNPSTEQAPQQRSPPHIHSLVSPPHTTPLLQNSSTKQAPQQHSPPHVHSLKSPPHTTPPLQNPPNALKKKDATMHETSKDPKIVFDKFYDGLKNYKTKKSLEDLTLVGMSVKEFWQHGDKDIWEFEYGKPLIPKHVHRKLSCIMQKLHECYYLACLWVEFY